MSNVKEEPFENENNDDDIVLGVLSPNDVEITRHWRNEVMSSLRTPYFLTYEMQQDFYNNTICNRDTKNKYFGLYLINKEYQKVDNELATQVNSSNINSFIGMGGLTNIEWENGIGEISLIMSPYHRGKGYGSHALNKLLKHAFKSLGLINIYGECYKCNPDLLFWEKQIEKYSAYKTMLPAKKYFEGSYYDSIYFNFVGFDFK